MTIGTFGPTIDPDSKDVLCMGGPIDGIRLPSMGDAMRFRAEGSTTWHLYRAGGADKQDMYEYVGVVEEAKK